MRAGLQRLSRSLSSLIINYARHLPVEYAFVSSGAKGQQQYALWDPHNERVLSSFTPFWLGRLNDFNHHVTASRDGNFIATVNSEGWPDQPDPSLRVSFEQVTWQRPPPTWSDGPTIRGDVELMATPLRIFNTQKGTTREFTALLPTVRQGQIQKIGSCSIDAWFVCWSSQQRERHRC